ncbi:MAG TPA: DUF11 domain-containing protein [Candidatus Polarisedimenticolaceae bacterium]
MKRTRLVLWLGSAALVLLAAAAITPAYALGTRAGTTITNQATVNFTDANGNPGTALSNVVSTTVSQVAGVTVDPDNNQNGTPGSTLYFPHLVTNTGNFDDTVNLAASSAAGWTVTLYRDVNGNQAYDAGTDLLLADTNGDTIPDSGLLADDGSMRILVAVSIPVGTANGTPDTVTVTGTTVFAPTATDSALDTINVQAPVLSVVKSVAPLGAQPPGTVLTYTIVVTNNGAGAANAVVLTDPAPTDTTYVPGSITVGGNPRTDAADPDDSDFGFTNAGQVTVNVGTLAAGGGSVTVTFQVTIN